MVAIPQDIIDSIIEAVGDDKRLLKKCALVSSSFLLPCRKHLFSKIFLGRNRACQRLHQVLVENPVVQSFVRSIIIDLDVLLDRKSLIALLRLPFCCLESLSINGDHGWFFASLNWNDLSSELKDILLTVLYSSTLLKTLHLIKINVPIMFFLDSDINLNKLVMTDLDFALNELDGRLLTPAASEGVATTASHTVVDHCVYKYFRALHGPAEPIFLPFMCRLRVLEIHISPLLSFTTLRDFDILSFLIRSLRVSLTSPATLEHIKLDIVFAAYNDDFDCDAFFDELRDADFWRHLDSIITYPTGSRLQGVDININHTFFGEDDDDTDVREPDSTEVSKPVLDALPLLRKKGILALTVQPL